MLMTPEISVNADIEVPAGDRSALLTFSRPYFRGYEARIGIRNSLSHLIADYFQFWKFQQAHMDGLRLSIDQLWLLWGGGLAAVSALIVLLGIIAACRYSSSTGTESCP